MQLSNTVTGAPWWRCAYKEPIAPSFRTRAHTVIPIAKPWPRYRKLGWFLTKTLFKLISWDVVLNRTTLAWWRTPPHPRWRQMAGEFRTLVMETGGVLVKLGQFMSLRFDLLPTEVTQELATLQDQMPAAPLAAVVEAIEIDVGRPLADLFAWFAPQPVAANRWPLRSCAPAPMGKSKWI
jgi:predicted unusual protein kinase regulating ubiquinone biosynthesis (AarF/ABC1/UbiB family)